MKKLKGISEKELSILKKFILENIEFNNNFIGDISLKLEDHLGSDKYFTLLDKNGVKTIKELRNFVIRVLE